MVRSPTRGASAAAPPELCQMLTNIAECLVTNSRLLQEMYPEREPEKGKRLRPQRMDSGAMPEDLPRLHSPQQMALEHAL